MTVSSLTTKNSYSGNGSTSAFSYTFKIFDDDDVTVIIRTDSTGTETVKTKTTHYTVSGVGNAGGGTITFTSGNIPASGETVLLLRNTPLTQATDYTPNDPFPAATHEDALDKLTLISQDTQEEIDRSIKLSRANTMTSTEFTVPAATRANKIFAFDSSGELAVTQEIGTFRGDWAASTAYAVRDLVKDTSTNNIFIVNEAHTSSGSQPLTTNANSAKYDLIVDAASATTSATAAASSATAAAASASTASTQASNASSSASTASTQASNASSSASTASTQASNAASSATAAASSATEAASSATSAASSAASITTGISENNILQATAGVADNDFLRVDGAKVEGRSASEVLSDIGAAPAAGDSNIVTTGALNSGSITSGFGSIDNGSSAISTTGAVSGGSAVLSSSSSGEFNALTISQANNTSGNESRIRFKRTTDAGSDREVAAIVADRAGGNDTDLVFETNTDGADGAVEKMRLNHLGILSVDQLFGLGDTDTGLALGANGADIMQLYTGNTERVNIDANGNTLLTCAAGDSNQALKAYHPTSTSSRTIAKFQSNVGSTQADKVTIGCDGKVTIADGDLVIGTSGHGIDFSATSDASGATSELLDDYEEGTWTPVLTTSSGTPATYGAQQIGKYVKIGDLVHIYFDIAINQINNSNTTLVSGHPFNSVNNDALAVSFFSTLAVSPVFVSFQCVGSSGFMAVGLTSAGANITNGMGIFGNSTRIIASGTYRTA